MNVRCVLLLLGLTLQVPGLAQEFKPYPGNKITPEQWQSYYEQVRSKLGRPAEESDQFHLVIFNDEENFTFYTFTMPGHPAHPAWITRRIVEEDGQISIAQVGYFAGEEAPFAELYRSYQQMNAQLRERMRQGEE